MVNNRKAFGIMIAGVDHLPTTYNRGKQAFSAGEPEWGAETAEDLVKLIGLHDASTIAAVIVEPVAGSTGCIPPPKGYLKRLREITESHGILLIFDEVITGFGRIGGAFSAERFGVVPDMITFAKGVTNGAVPMSGVMVRKGIYDAHMTGPDYAVELFHGFTYSGHPLAVAAGLATLRVYKEEGLFERARALEKPFADAMMSLKGLPNVADIRPIGMMCGIDLDPAPGKVGARGYEALERAFFEHDLYIRLATDTIVTAPPLIATEGQIGEMTDRIAALLRKLA
jgi:beta-alanine--pyruvate transaminase